MDGAFVLTRWALETLSAIVSMLIDAKLVGVVPSGRAMRTGFVWEAQLKSKDGASRKNVNPHKAVRRDERPVEDICDDAALDILWWS